MTDIPMKFFSENVDSWGAPEWFGRLADAIREQDKAVVAKDDIAFETYRMIAASSAMTLVRDHEATVRSALSAALSRPIDPKAEVEALVKPSIDTMREAAWEVLRKNGWEATARLSLHQVSGLMAQFGMNVSAGEVGCGYPDCGCCDDAACEDAIKQHPDFAPALTPAEKAGVGDGVRCYIAEMGLSDGRTDYYVTIECGGRQITPHMYRIKGRAEYDVAEWNWLFNGGEKPFVLDFDTEDRSLSTTKPAQGDGEAVADQIIGQIEDRFPNWRSYRDLIDCIDCTLHELRKGSRS